MVYLCIIFSTSNLSSHSKEARKNKYTQQVNVTSLNVKH